MQEALESILLDNTEQKQKQKPQSQTKPTRQPPAWQAVTEGLLEITLCLLLFHV